MQDLNHVLSAHSGSKSDKARKSERNWQLHAAIRIAIDYKHANTYLKQNIAERGEMMQTRVKR